MQAFYGVATHTNNRGLLQIKNWQKLSITRAAQSVQVSAYPDAYAKWEKLAREIVAENGETFLSGSTLVYLRAFQPHMG